MPYVRTEAEPTLGIVVAGSFNSENLPFISNEAGQFALQGVRIDAPRPFRQATNPDGSFILLDTDEPGISPRDLELGYLKAIANTNALIVANSRFCGKVGLSTAAEMAWARICGVSVAITHVPRIWNYPDISFAGSYTTAERAALERLPYFQLPAASFRYTAAELQNMVHRHEPLPEDHPDYPTLTDICRQLLESLSDQPTS